MIVRQVFPGWSIAIPAAFREASINEEDTEAYWRGYDARRSISLTSYLIIDELLGPVSGEDLIWLSIRNHPIPLSEDGPDRRRPRHRCSD